MQLVEQHVVNGRSLKHINQFYNKRKAHLQGKLDSTGTTAKLRYHFV